MSLDQSKAVYRSWIEEVWNRGNLAAADDLVATDCLDHNPLPGFPPGRAGLNQLATMVRTGHSDVHFTLEDLIAEGDKVVGRWTMQGTHDGPFLGVPPSGRPVTLSGIDIVRVAAGKIVEIWHLEDALGHMRQIGARPDPT